MKSKSFLLNTMFLIAIGGIAAAQSGGPFTIKDATVEGSAHVSSGGVFVKEARVGQGLAGQSISGGNFAVGGGFYPAPPPPPVTLPGAPSDLTVAAPSAELVVLFWRDQSINEDGFSIERCKLVGKRCRGFELLAEVGPDVDGFDDVTVDRNTGYQYRVRAFNAAGNSPFSNVVMVKTPRR